MQSGSRNSGARMKAARFYEARDVRIEDIDLPLATEDKVLLEVAWCGICGSDLNEYLAGPFGAPAQSPHPLTKETVPVTLGHEFTGTIVDSPSSSNLKKGQLVIVDPRLNCASCSPCLSNAAQCCRTCGFLGLSGGGGGLSEFVAVSPERCHVLPDGTDLAAAALIEPLAVAWHAVRRLGPKSFKSVPVLVIGGGPVGVAVVYALRALGADRIIVAEPSMGRREFFKNETFGNVVVESINPTEIAVGKRVRELTDGDGAQFVVDCAGSEKGFVSGCESLRFQGTYANLAVPKGQFSLPAIHFLVAELTYKSFMAYTTTDFTEVVQAFTEGKFSGIEKMITSRLSLDDIVGKGFEILAQGSEKEIKILATPKRIDQVF